MNAKDVFNANFKNLPGSKEWKAGVLYGLRLELGGSRGSTPKYYRENPHGSQANQQVIDWSAGVSEGRSFAKSMTNN